METKIEIKGDFFEDKEEFRAIMFYPEMRNSLIHIDEMVRHRLETHRLLVDEKDFLEEICKNIRKDCHFLFD